MKWIECEYKSSRGFELGTFNPSILPTLFQAQSKKWETLASMYITGAVTATHHFCKVLLTYLCSEERVATSLWSLLMDHLLQRYRRTVEHVEFLLRTEHLGTLLTTNHYFAENLEKSRKDRTIHLDFSKRLDKAPQDRCREQDHGFAIGKAPTETVAPRANLSNEEHTVRDIHDILKSYYKVARKRFVDNVCMQATDYHLITGPNTPLRVFSPEFVIDLSNEQLESIAGEGETSVERRKAIEKEIATLTEGRKILTT